MKRPEIIMQKLRRLERIARKNDPDKGGFFIVFGDDAGEILSKHGIAGHVEYFHFPGPPPEHWKRLPGVLF